LVFGKAAIRLEGMGGYFFRGKILARFPDADDVQAFDLLRGPLHRAI